MDETDVDPGAVTVPSGVLVLGMAGWSDYWPQVGRPLSERVRAAAAPGGGHLHGPGGSQLLAWTCEAIAVEAAADRSLQVRAQTSASPFDGEPTIAVLEVDLGLPRSGRDSAEPVQLGDLPVGKQPKLTARWQARLLQQHQSGEHTIAVLAELLSVSRATVCRVLERHATVAAAPARDGQ